MRGVFTQKRSIVMKLANTSKRVLPLFSIVFFLIAAICMIVDVLQVDYLKTFIDNFGWCNHLQIFGIQIPQLFPVVTDIVSIVLFCFLVFIAAALLAITTKHCYFPAVLGLFTLLFVSVMLLQEFLLSSEVSIFAIRSQYFFYTMPYMHTANICRVLYCLPVCILALYMMIASFLKITGKKIVIITVSVILLTFLATLLLSVPLDFLQILSPRGRNAFFNIHGIYDNYNLFSILSNFRFEYLTDSRIFGDNIVIKVLCTWLALFFQYGGFLLYLPAALYRPKTPKTEA